LHWPKATFAAVAVTVVPATTNVEAAMHSRTPAAAVLPRAVHALIAFFTGCPFVGATVWIRATRAQDALTGSSAPGVANSISS